MVQIAQCPIFIENGFINDLLFHGSFDESLEFFMLFDFEILCMVSNKRSLFI